LPWLHGSSIREGTASASCNGNERPGEVATVELTKDELRIASNAINEICNGPDANEGEEFDTRIGASRQDAEPLLDGLERLP
jgi:hypothetical protein